MTLQIIPNSNPQSYPFHKHEIWGNGKLACYARSLLIAHRARIEIEKSLKAQPKRMTQADIDRWANDEPPRRSIRSVYYRAAAGILKG